MKVAVDTLSQAPRDPTDAHQIVNTGRTVLRYLALSNQSDIEVCEYPDSNKVGVWASTPGGPALRKMFRAEAVVDYYDRESETPPPREGS